MPQFPIFTLCVNHVEHGQLDRAHSLIAVGQTGETLKTVMGAIAILVYEKLGLAILRTAWINLDLIWAGALVVAGMVSFVV